MKTVARIILDLLKSHFLLLVTLLLCGVAEAENLPYPLSQTVQNARLIFSARKDYAKYDLIVGRIEYLENADSEGFRPAEKRELIGSIDRRLYDYSKQKSAIQIYENTLASFKRQHYRIVYQCSGEACGGVAGWRLFLSDKLGGDSRFQHYVVAAKDSAAGASHYAVLYVNDLAGQPRALVDVVAVSQSVQRGDSQISDAKASIYFDLGQSALASRPEQLAHARQFVESHRGQCPIRVIGYTDAIGGEASNQTLAKARVDAVIAYLRDIKELSPSCLVPEPRGIEAGAVTQDQSESRRVDLELAARHQSGR